MKAYQDTKAYRDQSVTWIFATRGQVPIEVVDSWDQIQWPMNQFRSHRLTVKGAEVASAYNALTRVCMEKKLAHEVLGASPYADAVIKSKFVFTAEEDNIIPPYAIKQLLEAIYTCPDCGLEVAEHCAGKKVPCKKCKDWRCANGHKGYDAVSGLYSVKTNPATPMAFGHPDKPNDYRPRNVAKYVKAGTVVEVNGIAMGCAIFRKDLFKKVRKPWFQTGAGYTQDLFFCKKATKQAGARFGVHCGVHVGHLDVNTGEVI